MKQSAERETHLCMRIRFVHEQREKKQTAHSSEVDYMSAKEQKLGKYFSWDKEMQYNYLLPNSLEWDNG